MTTTAISNRKAFSVVLFIELWERFGYYGMQSILVLFLIYEMNFATRSANTLIGAFSAMTYVAPALGGWVGDKLLGNRKAMVGGTIILATGYFLLSVATGNNLTIFLSMAIISIGNGLFKPNAATLVRRIYDQDDSKLDAAFTIYYMAVNIGSTVSMLLCPYLKDHYGWKSAFLASFLGLVLGLVNYFITHRRLDPYLPEIEKQPLSTKLMAVTIFGVIIGIGICTIILKYPLLAQICVWIAAFTVIVLWGFTYYKSDSLHRPGLQLMYLLTVEGMLFFVFYQQMSTSLTLFAQRNINPAFYVGPYHLFSWSAGQFQALNPIWIMILSPILAKIYTYMSQKNYNMSIATKFVGGFICVAVAFLLWWVTCAYSQTTQLSSWLMVWGYFFLSLGELLISGLGLAVVARYVPASMNGFMTGAYFMASGVSMYIGSKIANIAAPANIEVLSPHQTLALYSKLFLNLSIMAVVALIILIALTPFAKKWDKYHRRNIA